MNYYNHNMNSGRCCVTNNECNRSNCVNGCNRGNCIDKECNWKDKYPIGMAYVPWQEWRNVMPAKEGICYGTIFSELVLPFYGCGKGGR